VLHQASAYALGEGSTIQGKKPGSGRKREGGEKASASAGHPGILTGQTAGGSLAQRKRKKERRSRLPDRPKRNSERKNQVAWLMKTEALPEHLRQRTKESTLSKL